MIGLLLSSGATIVVLYYYLATLLIGSSDIVVVFITTYLGLGSIVLPMWTMNVSNWLYHLIVNDFLFGDTATQKAYSHAKW